MFTVHHRTTLVFLSMHSRPQSRQYRSNTASSSNKFLPFFSAKTHRSFSWVTHAWNLASHQTVVIKVPFGPHCGPFAHFYPGIQKSVWWAAARSRAVKWNGWVKCWRRSRWETKIGLSESCLNYYRSRWSVYTDRRDFVVFVWTFIGERVVRRGRIR